MKYTRFYFPLAIVLVVSVLSCNLAPKRRTSDVPVIDGTMHTVQKGETLHRIANAYEVTPELLRRVNNIRDPDHLAAGKRIFIPGALESRVVAADQAMEQIAARSTKTPLSRDGLYHEVQKGETLSAIAAAYSEHDVTTRELQRVNRIQDPSHIQAGQTLWVPRAIEVKDVEVEPVKVVSADPVKEYEDDPRVKQEIKPQPTPKPTPKAKEEQVHEFPREVNDFAEKRFQWPIKDTFRVVRDFRLQGEKNTGIDLGAEMGTPVYAAADGKVELVGGPSDTMGASLGNYVIVYHGKRNGQGIYTVYGHNQSISVEPGQKVKRGEELAKVGRSGRPPESEGGVLHFQIREVTKAIDPKTVLPELK